MWFVKAFDEFKPPARASAQDLGQSRAGKKVLAFFMPDLIIPLILA
jgi:hypothetical protein